MLTFFILEPPDSGSGIFSSHDLHFRYAFPRGIQRGPRPPWPVRKGFLRETHSEGFPLNALFVPFAAQQKELAPRTARNSPLLLTEIFRRTKRLQYPRLSPARSPAARGAPARRGGSSARIRGRDAHFPAAGRGTGGACRGACEPGRGRDGNEVLNIEKIV